MDGRHIVFIPNNTINDLAQDQAALASDQHYNGFEHDLQNPAERQQQRPREAAGRDNVVLRALGECLVLASADGNYKAPVLVLSGEVPTVYSVIEKHFSAEVLNEKEEKFWRIIKAENSLETWRPRVQGQQLRALQNVRLPESADEYEQVRRTVTGLQQYLKPTSTVEMFMEDLQQLVGTIETWWENRNKRTADAAGSKRSASTAAGGSSKRHAADFQQQLQQQPNMLLQYQALQQHLTQSQPPTQPTQTSSTMMMWHTPQAPSGTAFPHNAAPPSQQLGIPGLPSMARDQQLQQPSELQQPAVVLLNVGGSSFCCSSTTLAAVPGSFFSRLAGSGPLPASALRTAPGEIFIDRSAEVFSYILEYLRACAHNEPHAPLPDTARQLQALAREAEFYQLPGLCERIQQHCVKPVPASCCRYDSLYLETGFNSIEGEALKEMDVRKALVMEQMNRVLQQKQADGFQVESCKGGILHREAVDGSMLLNVYYHIMLRKEQVIINRRGMSGTGMSGPSHASGSR